MVLTRSMMKKRSRPSFYSLDMSSGSSNVFIRKTKDSHGNTHREVIDLRKVEPQQPDSNNSRRRSSAIVVRRFIRHRRSRGSSLWESQPNQLVVQSMPQEELEPIPIAQDTVQQEFQPISMSWWLRTFRGVENQVGREVRQMLALQLGLFEQFKQWTDDDRMQLSKSLPGAIGNLEMIQSRMGALVAWVKRLQAILEQDSVEKIHRQTGALVGWAQHLHVLLQQDSVVAQGILDSIEDSANQVCKPLSTAAEIPMSCDHVEAISSESQVVDAPLNSGCEFVADAPLSPVKASSLPNLVDPFTCDSVAVPPYIRRSRSRGLSLVR